MAARHFLVGCDIGSTYTDLVLIDPATSRKVESCKLPSTPEDPLAAVEEGLRELCGGQQRAQIVELLHGTSVISSVLAKGDVAKVGIVTTRNQRHLLVAGRSKPPAPSTSGTGAPRLEPLALLEDMVLVDERIDVQGDEVTRVLDTSGLGESLRKFKHGDINSVAVVLHNAHAGRREKEVKELVDAELPGSAVFCSGDLPGATVGCVGELPERGEVERAATAIANASLQAYTESYMKRLTAVAYGMNVRVLRADGGLMSSADAVSSPVNMLNSGSAGGVSAALWAATRSGCNNFVTLDVGGETTKMSIVTAGKPRTRPTVSLPHTDVRAQAIDIHTVRLGGSSVITPDRASKVSRVGPESAGASPGPVCYGRGGSVATMADAHCFLGHLGRSIVGYTVDKGAAAEVLRELAKKMSAAPEFVATAAVDYATEAMVSGIRKLATEQGTEVRDYSLVAYGGAGGLHACAVAKQANLWPVIVPPSPGIFNALGAVVARPRAIRTCSPPNVCSAETLTDIIELMTEQAKKELEQGRGMGAAVPEASVTVFVKFVGQSADQALPIAVPSLETLRVSGCEWLYQKHADEYKHRFGFTTGLPHVLHSIRVAVECPLHGSTFPVLAKGTPDPPEEARLGTQRQRSSEVPVFDRSKLLANNTIEGPAVVADTDGTVLILAGCVATVDSNAALVIKNTAPKPPPPLQTQLQPVAYMATLAVGEEMSAAVRRLAVSPCMKDPNMLSFGVTVPEGANVAGTLCLSRVQSHLAKLPLDGDVFLVSDPYQGGTSSQAEWTLVTVVHHPDGPVAWVGISGVVSDVGRPMIETTDYTQEGVRVPITKAFKKGYPNGDLIEGMLHQTKCKDATRCDFKALMAGLAVGRSRIADLCTRYGPSTFLQAASTYTRARQSAFSTLISERVPKHADRVEFADYLCDDGTGHGPVRIVCSLYRSISPAAESTAVFDFTGTDAQTPGSVNLASLNTESFRSLCAKRLAAVCGEGESDVFNATASLIDIKVPDGTVVSASSPAALAHSSQVAGRVRDVVEGVLAGLGHGGCAAGAAGTAEVTFWRHGDPLTTLHCSVPSGCPGSKDGDGQDVAAWGVGFRYPGCEVMEQEGWVSVSGFEIVADSGGAGEYRGGNGCRVELVFRADGQIRVSDDRWLIPPWGAYGGAPGQRSRRTLCRADGSTEVLAAKACGVAVQKGDRLVFVTSGGGGWGSPLDRDRHQIIQDVRRDLVSKEGARSGYGLVIGPTFSVAESESAAARQQIKEASGKFDFGWRESAVEATAAELDQLRDQCKEATELPAPAAAAADGLH
eukprot:TRINITY_DN9118_c0_g1_i1.p1 TRINITY_DN9118_c0_g1~~TRINITY_DN9118_c0_g1_i1.p1  ORF type:complete len:1345 (+),score=412.38 TRINITY_DN9118_c0_g1_i1:129-4037(+)